MADISLSSESPGVVLRHFGIGFVVHRSYFYQGFKSFEIVDLIHTNTYRRFIGCNANFDRHYDSLRTVVPVQKSCATGVSHLIRNPYRQLVKVAITTVAKWSLLLEQSFARSFLLEQSFARMDYDLIRMECLVQA